MSSAYITPEGHDALQLELRSLWERRATVTAALAAAAAEGDRSENAEYIYRKKELRGIDRRIGYLQRRIPALKVVRETGGTDRVYFGAWVTIEDEAGALRTHRIVGPDEFDRGVDYISIDSPLARALLGRAIDDEVSFNAGETEERLSIVAIRYAAAPAS